VTVPGGASDNGMRLWTIHPKYLDPQGLVALWREALLARAVLRGETKGYRHHPQLHRFQAQAAPRSAINAYLSSVLLEAESRGYAFNGNKVGPARTQVRISCTTGQLRYEWQHLLAKLSSRSPVHHRRWRGVASPEPHPLFRIRAGEIEPWERKRGNASLSVSGAASASRLRS
jgi:hypothetical protein